MRAVPAIVLATLVLSVMAQDSDSENEKNNVIEPKTSLRLDPFIRKALLKALSDLEASDPTTEIDSDETTSDELLRAGDEITEMVPTPGSNSDVQYHSYVVDGRQAFSNSTSFSPTILQENLIITTTVGNVENQISGTSPTPDPFNELFQTKESSNNLQQVRSIQSNSLNSNSEPDKETKKTYKEKATTTTLPPTPTTTTTPKPTHNDDGENIEVVSDRDVQVFPAPLVAAFTVHQDELGLPRKVVPIFQPSRQPQTPTKPQPTLVAQQKPTQNDFLAQQVALQQQLEQKQRVLEEQLRLLQLQQKQQEDYLRNQQLVLQQKEIQRQQFYQQDELKNQQLQQEQQRLHQQNLQHITELQKQSNFQNNFRAQSNVQQGQNIGVSIQPSVSFDASNAATNQQLPNREAVDFLLHLRNQQREQFPLQQNHLPQGIGNLQLPPLVGNFQQQQQFQQSSGNFQQGGGNFQQGGGNFQQNRGNFQQNNGQQQNFGNFQQQQQVGNFQQQQGSFQPQPSVSFQQQPSIGFQQQLPVQNNFVPNQNFRHGNRVFRQESGTGNFGFNNNANQYRFGGFQPINPDRFQGRPQFGGFPAADAELQQLLQQSGVNGRSQEDINIVSKVLALNHGIGPANIVSNRLNFPFADSRRRTRKAPARST